MYSYVFLNQVDRMRTAWVVAAVYMTVVFSCFAVPGIVYLKRGNDQQARAGDFHHYSFSVQRYNASDYPCDKLTDGTCSTSAHPDHVPHCDSVTTNSTCITSRCCKRTRCTGTCSRRVCTGIGSDRSCHTQLYCCGRVCAEHGYNRYQRLFGTCYNIEIDVVPIGSKTRQNRYTLQKNCDFDDQQRGCESEFRSTYSVDMNVMLWYDSQTDTVRQDAPNEGNYDKQIGVILLSVWCGFTFLGLVVMFIKIIRENVRKKPAKRTDSVEW